MKLPDMAWTLAATLALWAAPPVGAAPPRASQSLTLELSHAVERAGKSNAALAAARLRIDEMRGDAVGAAIRLTDNPELSLTAGSRRPGDGPGASSTDFSLGLEQRFELRGQRRLRMAQADDLLRTVEYEAQEVRRVVELAAAIAFFDALAGRERVQVREDGEALASKLFELAERRLDAGEGTPLEVNTARLRRASARQEVLEARSAERLAKLALAELLDLGSGKVFEVAGTLPKQGPTQGKEALVAQAIESRPDRRAAAHLQQAAQTAVELADAEVWPALRAGVSFDREEGDEIALGSITVPLPLTNRNRGERLRSRATVDRLAAEERAIILAVEMEVRAAFTEYERAAQTLELFDKDVLAAQQESLGLLERALEAGEVGYAEVLVVQREVLDARAKHLQARLALAQARVVLLAATNLSLTLPNGGAP